jgi:mannose-6-phosphate isomerase
MNEGIFKLTGKVQHYEWGGYDFIPELLGIQKENNKPFAEYWMGAHPSASSSIAVDGKPVSLNQVIQQEPSTFIGDAVYKKFGELPYLFKVLDVRDMLSIQVHPTKEEAVKGFASEEAAGISINAPHRNYKDKNHKPEIMVALSEFWLLHGFKQKEELNETLNVVPEFKFLLPVFKEHGYKGLYKEVMELSQERVDQVLSPLAKRELAHKNQLTKEQAGYWVNKLLQTGEQIANIDRGVFSIYFFNIVKVLPGEGVFQGAGIPHAYLEGQNIELMANSDNVLRGGLTTKHIDVQELLKHAKFEGVTPDVMKGEKVNDVENIYPCSVADFGISLIKLPTGAEYSHKSYSAEIYLVTEGVIQLTSNKSIGKGEALFVTASTEVFFIASQESVVYKACVPIITS